MGVVEQFLERRRHKRRSPSTCGYDRRDRTLARALDEDSTPVWIYLVGAVALALALLVVILPLTGANPTHH